MSHNIGLSKEGTEKVAKHLNGYLADLHVLYTKLHNYHWNIEGKDFFTVHAKLEELYDGTAKEIDEVAERILIIGHRPAASMKEYLSLATLKEADSKSIDSKEILTDLLKDFTTLILSLREGIKVAQEAEDEVSADMLIGSLGALEKTVWMLNASLK